MYKCHRFTDLIKFFNCLWKLKNYKSVKLLRYNYNALS
jgi:hypothetical protein